MKYFLREKIHDVFEKYDCENALKGKKMKCSEKEKSSEEWNNSDLLYYNNYGNNYINKENNLLYRIKNKLHTSDVNKKNVIKENINTDKENDLTLFSENKNYLFIENYTSVIYENCEDKINIILSNEYIPNGNIEIQIKGNDTFIVPCNITQNILSCYLPQLTRGIYNIYIFINKEMVFIKLLRPGFSLSENSKFLILHVIEIVDFSYCENRQEKKKNRKKIFDLNKSYDIASNNNTFTNKELLKIYNNLYKKYYTNVNDKIRSDQIAIGQNYKLKITNDNKFYEFLNSYKNEFINHSFRTKKNNSNIDMNNINIVSQLNLENCTTQNRIPILYKRLLYDTCIYENKIIIMQFHSKIFEYDPFNMLSAHIFTKDELKDGYTIFALNLVPTWEIENRATDNSSANNNQDGNLKNNIFEMKNKEYLDQNNYPIKIMNMSEKYIKRKKKKNYVSSLMIFRSDEANCADVRLWEYIKTIDCAKNNICNNFYINKNNYKNDIQCPVPDELINNKNIFRKYSQGLKISEQVSIFFENWNENILPVQKFVQSPKYNLPYLKTQDLSNFLKNKKEDILLISDFCKTKEQTSDMLNSEQKKELPYNTTLLDSSKNETAKNSEVGKNGNAACLLNNFISFVFVLNGKIYHSVVPINKVLLLFIINYWMHFVNTNKRR
ncbi:conserved Plasmodium protein, unknown function [Plasmodium berghei]|uniref:Uncharacterized protein n=2 Tax=Plasmodium berghei TaxID=5821 RepID=A0A509AFB6_PLABA|nr:conserved protein, unknown function [Plasmodium berghei ANKA]CXH95362.1 conserved Plasmodium protein, unknown function [Plasmodium berghei]SCL91009.1 conserved Plasmodium protein, unknown function [Plasmodium berghei]SCM15405.1 conserved Plasmodium protein, unknown function [Plasmodium berghei]SCM17200.1 conserved Plasmodium protein, unknown function [Plasmodium berghei]SCN22260.1 conserved Plasmodium protein, unknown function [Plasmodium berghei]|eukprot:XP_034419990.1 conserved protein, unknown function [Plasmodium berghei ANKA]